MKALSHWDPSCYVNIWVIKDILNQGETSSIAGYANLPGLHGFFGDGIVVEAEWVGANAADETVLIHEMGHYLGLYHTFEGGCGNGNCLLNGDRVCDTPPDKTNSAVFCDAVVNSCTTDTQSGFSSDQNDMFENFMDYSWFDCQNRFTLGQKERMLYFLTNTRKSLLACSSCQDPCPVTPSLMVSADHLQIGAGQTVNFLAETEHIDEVEWRIKDQVIGQGNALTYTFNAPGIYTVQVTGSTNNPSCTNEYSSISIQVFCPQEAKIATESLEVYEGGTLAFTGSALYGATSEWWVNGVFAGYGPELEYTFTGSGVQAVIFRASGTMDCDAAEATVFVNVVCPVEVAIQTESGFGLVGQTITFTAFSEHTDQFEWWINGNLIQTGEALIHQFENDTTYQIQLKGLNPTGSCFSTDILNFQVFCDLAVNILNPPDSIQVNQSLTLEALTKGSTSTEWKIDGNVVGAETSLTYIFEEVGLHEVTLSATGEHAACASLSQTILIWVFCPSNAVSIIPGQDNYEVGQKVTFSAAAENVDQLEWIIDDEVVGSGEILMYEFLSDGEKEVILLGKVNNDACEQVVDRLIINVTCPLTGDIASDRSVINPGESIYFSSEYPEAEHLDWYVNDAKVGENSDLQYQFPNPGAYEVYLLARFKDCYERSGSIFIHVRENCDYDHYRNHFVVFNSGFFGIWMSETSDLGYYFLGDSKLTKFDQEKEVEWFSRIEMRFSGAIIDPADEGVIAYGSIRNVSESIIVKYSRTGDLLWQTQILENSFPNVLIKKIIVLPNQQFACIGYFRNSAGTAAYNHGFIINLDNKGNIINQLVFDQMQPHQVMLTSDGDYLLLGINLVSRHAFSVMKVDLNNNIIWNRSYGPTISFYTSDFNHLVEFSDQSYLIGAYSNVPQEGHFSYLTRIDHNGNVIWAKNLNPTRQSPEMIGAMCRLPNDQVVFSIEQQFRQEDDPLIYGQLDKEGNIRWGRTTQGPATYIRYIMMSNEGKIFFTGRNEHSHNHFFTTNAQGIFTGCDLNSTKIKLTKVALPTKSASPQIKQGFEFKKATIAFESDNFVSHAFAYPECRVDGLKAFDAGIQVVELQECPENLFIHTEICNAGNIAIPAEMPLQIYKDNPLEATSSPISGLFLNKEIGPNSCDTIVLTVSSDAAADASFLYVALNDNGNNETPYQLSQGFAPDALYECNYQNNLDAVLLSEAIHIPSPVQPFDLGPTDTTLCNNEQLKIGIDNNSQFLAPVWQDGLEEYQRTISTPGTYVLTAFDRCGKAYQDTINIHVYTPPLSLNLGPDRTVCGSQVFTFQAPEGYASYRWQDGSYEPSFTAWEEGHYWVEATDVCGRVYTDTVRISYDVSTIFDLGPDTLICRGESVSLRGIAGFDTYQWHPEKSISCTDCLEAIVSPDTTTTYFLVATNSSGCISSDTLRIEVGYPSERTDRMSICEGEAASVFDLLLTEPGLYSQKFTSRAGCDSIVHVQLEVVPLKSSEETVTICTGDSAFIFGQPQTEAGSYTKSFDNGVECDSIHTIHLEVLEPILVKEDIYLCEGQSITLFGKPVSAPGRYEQTFTGQSGCDSIQQYLVLVQDAIRTQERLAICRGTTGSVFGQLVGEAGIYTQSFVASSGCDSIHQIEVVILDTVATEETLQICAGESITIFGIERTAAGVFQAQFSAANGCDSTHLIRLEVLEKPVTSEFITICSGSTYSVFGEEKTESGTFSQSFAAANGCDSTHQIILSVLPALSSRETIMACEGDSVLLSGNFVYQSTVLEHRFTSASGCDSVHTIEVVFQGSPDLTYEVMPACSGADNGAVTFLGSSPGGHTFQWSNGFNTPGIAQLTPGNYQLTVTDEQGCSIAKGFAVPEFPYPGYDFRWQNVSCPGERNGLIEVTALHEALEFSFDGINFTTDGLFDQLPEGNYELHVRNILGCLYIEEITLGTDEVIQIDLPDTLSMITGDSLQIPLTTQPLGAFSYEWSPAQGLSCTDCANPVAAPLENTTYQVKVTDERQCPAQRHITILVEDAPGIAPPNAFSPNGDGLNETFVISGIEQFPKAELIVVNRWGAVVFSAQPYQNDWGGENQQGLPLPEGTYYFLLRLDISEKAPLTGPITIIR